MARTQVTGKQVGDGSIQRDDLDTSTVGQALVRKLVQGGGVLLSSTGADAGTGDVTVAHGSSAASGLHVDSPGTLLTTKGDILSYSTLPVRHAAGANGEVQMWDSNGTDGLVNAVLDDAQAYNDLLGRSYDQGFGANTTVVPNAAVIWMSKIPLRRVLSVTNILVNLLTAAGSTLTNCYVTLFKSNGVVIGQSADQSANWDTGSPTGVLTHALASGPFTCTPLAANDFMWASLYVGTSAGTLPAFARGLFGSGGNAGCTTARSRMAQQALANTATITNITPGSITPNSLLYWFGLN